MGRDGVVGILLAELVLDKILRPGQFADVVVVGPYPAKQAVGADGVGRRLRQVSHHDAVAERPVGFLAEASQQRVVEIG